MLLLVALGLCIPLQNNLQLSYHKGAGGYSGGIIEMYVVSDGRLKAPCCSKYQMWNLTCFPGIIWFLPLITKTSIAKIAAGHVARTVDGILNLKWLLQWLNIFLATVHSNMRWGIFHSSCLRTCSLASWKILPHWSLHHLFKDGRDVSITSRRLIYCGSVTNNSCIFMHFSFFISMLFNLWRTACDLKLFAPHGRCHWAALENKQLNEQENKFRNAKTNTGKGGKSFFLKKHAS